MVLMLFFDLEWEAGPYSAGMGKKLIPTPPASAIRFVQDSAKDTVSASFIYLPYDTEPANSAYTEVRVNSWSIKEFEALAMQNLARFGAMDCFNAAPERRSAMVA